MTISNRFLVLVAVIFTGCIEIPMVIYGVDEKPSGADASVAGDSSSASSIEMVTSHAASSFPRSSSADSSGSLSGDSSSRRDSSSVNTVVDAGGTMDAGSIMDAAVMDAASMPDAGSVPDASVADAGQLPDAAVPEFEDVICERSARDAESEEGIVVAGGVNTVLGKFRCAAGTNNLVMQKARFGISPAYAQSVISLSLYDGTTRLAGPVALSAHSAANFTMFSLPIYSLSWKSFTVRANLNSITNGAISGADVSVAFCNGYDDGVDAPGCGPAGSEEGALEFIDTLTGVSSSHFLGGDILGYEKRLRKTRPYVFSVPLPSTVLSNGVQIISRVAITAYEAGDVSLKHFSYETFINDQGGSLLTMERAGVESSVREVGESMDLEGSALYGAACFTGHICLIQVEFAYEQVVPAGTTKVYELRSMISGADLAGESISTRMIQDEWQVTGELDGATPMPATRIDDLDGVAAPGYYNFVWSDNSAMPHNDTKATDGDGTDDLVASNDWTNGRFVKGLTTDTQTMLR